MATAGEVGALVSGYADAASALEVTASALGLWSFTAGMRAILRERRGGPVFHRLWTRAWWLSALACATVAAGAAGMLIRGLSTGRWDTPVAEVSGAWGWIVLLGGSLIAVAPLFSVATATGATRKWFAACAQSQRAAPTAPGLPSGG